jgi:hypothetical protein
MKHLWTVLMLVTVAINLAPVLGAVSDGRMSAFYGIDLADANIRVLMRHRAVLFGIVGGLLLASVFNSSLRTLAYVVGFTSMLSFLLIAWLVGDYGAGIRRTIGLDVVGIAALTGAVLVHGLWLRGADD